jgi:hypothetical protein
MVVPVIDLYIGILALLFSVMAVIVSESADARIIFTTLAACTFFFAGFDLLVDAFHLSATVFYVLAGLSILGTIVYAGMSASSIVNSCNAACATPIEEHKTVNLKK